MSDSAETSETYTPEQLSSLIRSLQGQIEVLQHTLRAEEAIVGPMTGDFSQALLLQNHIRLRQYEDRMQRAAAPSQPQPFRLDSDRMRRAADAATQPFRLDLDRMRRAADAAVPGLNLFRANTIDYNGNDDLQDVDGDERPNIVQYV